MVEARQGAQALLDAYPWPKGYSYDMGSEWGQRFRNQQQFSEGILLAVFLVYVVMACLFESLRQPLPDG